MVYAGRVWDFGTWQAEGACLRDQPPIETLDTQSPESFLGNTSHGLHRSLPGKGRAPGFLWTLPHVLSPFAGFALNPLAVIIPHNWEDDCVLSPVSPVSHQT